MDKEEGKIRFEIRQDHKYIQVDITDNGRGIAEEIKLIYLIGFIEQTALETPIQEVQD